MQEIRQEIHHDDGEGDDQEQAEQDGRIACL
jgi:hypothetical protein